MNWSRRAGSYGQVATSIPYVAPVHNGYVASSSSSVPPRPLRARPWPGRRQGGRPPAGHRRDLSSGVLRPPRSKPEAQGSVPGAHIPRQHISTAESDAPGPADRDQPRSSSGGVASPSERASRVVPPAALVRISSTQALPMAVLAVLLLLDVLLGGIGGALRIRLDRAGLAVQAGILNPRAPRRPADARPSTGRRRSLSRALRRLGQQSRSNGARWQPQTKTAQRPRTSLPLECGRTP